MSDTNLSGSNNLRKSSEGSGVKPTKSSESKQKSKTPSEAKSTSSEAKSKVKSKTPSQTNSKSDVKAKNSSQSKSKTGLVSRSKSSEAKGKSSPDAKSKTSPGKKSSPDTKSKTSPGKKSSPDTKSKTGGSKVIARSSESRCQSVLSRKKGSSDILQIEQVNVKSDKSGMEAVCNTRIGFIGAGKMTTSIVRGLINRAKVSPKRIFVSAKTNRNLEFFKSEYGLVTTTRMYDIFGYFNCDMIFFCIHGYVIRACFKNGGTRPMALATNYIPNLKHPLYFLSLVGGVTLNEIKQTLLDPEDPDKYKIHFMHRLVLNNCVLDGNGFAVIDVDIESKSMNPLVKVLLNILNKYIMCQPEQLMDALCTLCGSGLAFIYYFINAMSEGGLKIGLNKEMGYKLVARVMQSAAMCVEKSEKELSVLQDSVLSKGGPAIYGIDVLNKSNCDAGFQNAVEASYRRLKELANNEPNEEEYKPPNA